MNLTRPFTALAAALGISACASHPPITTVERVDLPRFMGDWYVIAHIPTAIEDQAYDAVESYALADDGTVATTFTFREGGFDGERKVYTPTGLPDPETGNAVWGMRFIWPIKAEYRVIWLDEDYAVTVIGRSARDYVWIMAREPSIPDDVYRGILRFLEEQAYDLSQLREVPHSGA